MRSQNGPRSTVLDGGGILGMEVVTFNSGEENDSVLDGFTVRNGYGAFGGAISIWHSSPTIRNCVVVGSRAQEAGGGIYCNTASPIIVNTVVSGNVAISGGGIALDEGSTLTLVNSTIAGNHATSWGGGLLVVGGNSLSMVNSVVWGNAADTAFDEIYVSATAVMNADYSNIRIDEPGQLWAGDGNMNVDPLFVSARDPANAPDFGGDYHLRHDSPVINAGTDNGTSFPGIPADDIDGDARPEGSGLDMGADEYLTSTSDSDGDGYGDGVDCEKLDSAIHPGVTEGPLAAAVCRDGVDNDCDGLVDRIDDECRFQDMPALFLILGEEEYP